MESYSEKMDREAKERREWLNSLKVGDEVALDAKYSFYMPVIRPIVKITLKQFVLQCGYRAWREDGRVLGSGDYYSISPVTDEVKKTLLTNRLKTKVGGFSEWYRLSFEQLSAVAKVIDEYTASLSSDSGR